MVGFTTDEYPAVIAGLEESAAGGQSTGIDAYELNVSCPNTNAGGMEFGADPTSLRAVVAGARRETKRPIFVKLSPTLDKIGDPVKGLVPAGLPAVHQRRVREEREVEAEEAARLARGRGKRIAISQGYRPSRRRSNRQQSGRLPRGGRSPLWRGARDQQSGGRMEQRKDGILERWKKIRENHAILK